MEDPDYRPPQDDAGEVCGCVGGCASTALLIAGICVLVLLLIGMAAESGWL